MILLNLKPRGSMPKLHETKILPYSHKQLFDLVMDVEAYPEFLPFCVGSRVMNVSKTGHNKHDCHPSTPDCHPREGGDPGATISPLGSGINNDLVTLDSRLRGNDNNGYGDDYTVAELTVKFGLIAKSYRSLIKPSFDKTKASITVRAISGPFKYLENLWKFTQLDNGTLVEFSLDFEFESLFLSGMGSGIITKAYEHMINAFETRAKKVYG